MTLNALQLSGEVALVTGGGSGIGQRIAMGLAQCGADIALIDRRSDDGWHRPQPRLHRQDAGPSPSPPMSPTRARWP
jgi:NAD(P)-dependent dehydrogenase (short-subunit alcohol dehydrogenase family)